MNDIRTEVVIVGAGISGLSQAAALAAAGIEFLVLEKASDLGGTWRDNTYPGASCDVESHLYSYARDPNPDWSSTYAGQPEILEYLRRVADRRGVRPHIRYDTEVTAARWQPEQGRWIVDTAGARISCRFLVLGVGGLHVPASPELPGAQNFTGVSWHTSNWNHHVELTDKHVTLIGVGASGVQVVPHLAAQAAGLTVFQRTPAWVLPKADVAFSDGRRRLFRLLPWTRALYRLSIFLGREKRGLGFHTRPEALRVAEPVVLGKISEQISDPLLRERLTPSYRLGCKRVLFSNDYYRSLDRPNVHVVTGEPTELRESAVVDDTGHEHRTDVLIYATGFDLLGSYRRIRIEGIGGASLEDAWRDGAHTYHGVAVSGFPNMFILLAPHSVVAYTGVVVNIEAQARYVVRAIRVAGDDRSMTVRPEAQERFQQKIRRKFQQTIWHGGGCRNWYQNDSPSGTILWPGSTLAYRMLLRRVRREDFAFTTVDR